MYSFSYAFGVCKFFSFGVSARCDSAVSGWTADGDGEPGEGGGGGSHAAGLSDCH